MKFQFLVSSLNRHPHELLEEMNIRFPAIVINQCDSMAAKQVQFNGANVLWIDFPDRGIGTSRNEALMRAAGDIVLFCDEDCSYFENTGEIIVKEFDSHPDADIILFDLIPEGVQSNRKTLRITSEKRVRRHSFMRYGAVHIAARLASLKKNDIYFSQLFGGGARYSCGEDSAFLKRCLDSGLRIITSPVTVGTVDFSSSSWFDGYSNQYFNDQGALYYRLFGKGHVILSLRAAVKHTLASGSVKQGLHALRLMNKGANDYGSR